MKATPLRLFIWSLVLGFASLSGTSLSAMVLITKGLSDIMLTVVLIGFGGITVAWFLSIIAIITQYIDLVNKPQPPNQEE